MTQNKKAVEKRKKEIQQEELDNKIKHIYMQKDEDRSLFEIKYVEFQNPFYQANNLYVFTLQCELFE